VGLFSFSWVLASGTSARLVVQILLFCTTEGISLLGIAKAVKPHRAKKFLVMHLAGAGGLCFLRV
jgi:hypothetical protein